jgi:asparagine synthase (glutamine-hydrolysing)
MRRLRGRDMDLHAFSFITDAPGIGEERYVDIAGQAVQAVVHKVACTPTDLEHDLERLVYMQDEPFITTSVYAQYRVFQAAGEAGVKVLLDGQGVDETFAGYAWFYAVRAAGLLRRGDIAGARRLLAVARNDCHLGMSTSTRLLAAGILPTSLVHLGLRAAEARYQPTWLSASWFRDRSVSPASCHTMDLGLHNLGAAARVSQAQSLPMLLRYEDRNSMAFSVESRVPFVVPSIMEFAPALPDEYLIDAHGVSKAVLRQSMRGIVPDVILDRADKIGFDTPEQQWLFALTPWIERTLFGADPRGLPVLDHRAVREHWQAVCRNQRPFTSAIWRWVNLTIWSRHFGVFFE